MRFATIIGLIFILSALGLTYEIAAGRILAPFFGTSLLTWTAVIATVLAGFSLGSAIGGLIAEKEEAEAVGTVRSALVVTAVLMAVSPMVLGFIYTIGARGTGGMLLSVFVAFFPASVFVTIPTPFLAKLAVQARPGREGSSLGLVLAAGSLGAIVGAVVAGFVALPFAGSAATFRGCGVAAFLCVFFIHARKSTGDPSTTDPRFLLSLAPAALLVGASLFGSSPCRYESGLSCVDVARADGAIRLFSDRVTQAAEKSVAGTDGGGPSLELTLPYTQWLWARMDADLDADASVLFIGGGGYTLPTKLLAARPAAGAIVVEIDPLITDVVRERMPLAGDMIAREGYRAPVRGEARVTDGRRLGIVHLDGRVFVNTTDRQFSAAVMDAFSSGSVPAHLATRETYERLRGIVDGPVYVNVIDRPGGRLVQGIHAILSELYPFVSAVQGPVNSVGRTNIVLAASSAQLSEIEAYPEGYAQVEIEASRAFTDDRGWVGHR